MTSAIAIDSQTNDLFLDESTGRFVELQNLAKLSQDIADCLDSVVQEDDTGVGIQSYIAKPTDQFAVRASLSKDISRALGALKLIHDTTQKGDRTFGERIARITKLVVTAVQDGPASLSNTDFAYRVDVQSIAGTQSSTSGGLGSNQ